MTECYLRWCSFIRTFHEMDIFQKNTHSENWFRKTEKPEVPAPACRTGAVVRTGPTEGPWLGGGARPQGIAGSVTGRLAAAKPSLKEDSSRILCICFDAEFRDRVLTSVILRKEGRTFILLFLSCLTFPIQSYPKGRAVLRKTI